MVQEAPFKKHWLLGHTKHFAASTLGFVEACMQTEAPIVKSRIAFRNFYVLLSPEAIQQVTQKKHRSYKKSFAYKGLSDFLGQGLLTAEGEQWLANRRAMQPAFHRQALQNLASTMTTTTQEWLKKVDSAPIGIQQEMLELTREILVHTLFGSNTEDIPHLNELGDILLELRLYGNDRMKNPLMPPLSAPTRRNKRVKAAIEKLESIIYQILKQKKGEEGLDLLTMLLQHLKDSNWTDQQIYDELVTLFIAGQETTSNALAFAFHMLAQHPEWIDKVRDDEEARKAFIQEVLRFYPPAWAISREALEEDEIMGASIKKGDTVFLSIYAMHRHPEYWKNPEVFDPSRDFNKAAYMPFGLGPRMCIGNHFALMEMDIILKETLELFIPEELPNQQFQLITPMTMGLKQDLKFKLTSRK